MLWMVSSDASYVLSDGVSSNTTSTPAPWSSIPGEIQQRQKCDTDMSGTNILHTNVFSNALILSDGWQKRSLVHKISTTYSQKFYCYYGMSEGRKLREHQLTMFICGKWLVKPRQIKTKVSIYISMKYNTHTCLTALCPGLPRWAGTRKIKPIWILLKQETVSGSGISWAICKSAPRSRQITMPAPHHSVILQAGCLSCRRTNSVKATKAWSTIHTTEFFVKDHLRQFLFNQVL